VGSNANFDLLEDDTALARVTAQATLARRARLTRGSPVGVSRDPVGIERRQTHDLDLAGVAAFARHARGPTGSTLAAIAANGART
jgi:hypothetical protein